MNDARETVVVVGAGPQALFLVRELSRLKYKVLLVGRSNEIAMHSKYAEKIIVQSEEHLVLKLSSLANTHPKMKAYVASGFYLAFLVNHFPKYFQIFQAFPGDKRSVNTLMQKSKTYELAEKSGISYPVNHTLREIEEKNLYHELSYPQIVKWNMDIYLFAKLVFKTQLVHNQKELLDLVKAIKPADKAALICQEFLGADLKNNFSYGAFVEQGEVKLDICVNEVRHFRSGVSSVVEEYTGTYADAIKKQAGALIEQTNFTGFLDVEFKIKEGVLYLLEVNPRPFGFIKIMKKKYPDLIPYVMGHKKEIYKNPKPVRWMNVLRDMVLILKNPKEAMHMLKVLFDFNKRTFDVWDISDPKPFFYQMKR